MDIRASAAVPQHVIEKHGIPDILRGRPKERVTLRFDPLDTVTLPGFGYASHKKGPAVNLLRRVEVKGLHKWAPYPSISLLMVPTAIKPSESMPTESFRPPYTAAIVVSASGISEILVSHVVDRRLISEASKAGIYSETVG